MQKIIIFLGLFLLLSVNSFAQSTLNYSGTWKLDKARSTLDPDARIETVALKVKHVDENLTVETAITREPSTGGNLISGGDGTVTYTLDGKEVAIERDSYRGKVSVQKKGEIMPDGKLSLITSQMGVFNKVEGLSTLKQIWELLDEGKTLKITRLTSIPNRDIKTEMIFIKNE